jgi:hypothetical protein
LAVVLNTNLPETDRDRIAGTTSIFALSITKSRPLARTTALYPNLESQVPDKFPAFSKDIVDSRFLAFLEKHEIPFNPGIRRRKTHILYSAIANDIIANQQQWRYRYKRCAAGLLNQTVQTTITDLEWLYNSDNLSANPQKMFVAPFLEIPWQTDIHHVNQLPPSTEP